MSDRLPIKGRYRIKLDGEDVFISAVLICCAWEKIEWYWFWIVFVLALLSTKLWEH